LASTPPAAITTPEQAQAAYQQIFANLHQALTVGPFAQQVRQWNGQQ